MSADAPRHAAPGPAAPTRASNAHLNSIRAAVLGANDGVVSVASIILGVAGATESRSAVLVAGMAGLAAGALSMAVGEFVSVSGQRDTERAYIRTEKWRLEQYPEEEFEDLARTFQSKGLSAATAHQVARELTEHDAVAAHLDAELHLNEEDLSSPVGAGLASLGAFTLGGIIPLGAVLTVSRQARLPVTVVAVLVTLLITGYVSAVVGRTSKAQAILRVTVGGAIAMLITYCIGHVVSSIVGHPL